MQKQDKKLDVKKNIPLSKLTTMRVGGNARFFCIVRDINDLKEVLNFVKKNKIPFFILGDGSNVIFSDSGFGGVVIKIDIKGISQEDRKDGRVLVMANAGENWDAFVGYVVDNGLYGIENLSYIPGTVGATPIQNVGAYGMSVSETIEYIDVFDIKANKIKRLTNSKCNFKYRESVFKTNKDLIILSVTFLLKKNGVVNTSYKDVEVFFKLKKIKNPNLKDMRNAIVDIRKKKLPDIKEIGTVGSFFKNPIISLVKLKVLKKRYPDIPSFKISSNEFKIPLAWIFDNVYKLNDFRKGRVGFYKNQPLALVNYGDATSEDIKNLAEDITKKIKDDIGIDILKEVVFL